MHMSSREEERSARLPYLTVGVLVAKTLANASANPFIASAAGVYNPVLALDVFLVQWLPTGCCLTHGHSTCEVRTKLTQGYRDALMPEDTRVWHIPMGG
eukprot:1160228-Pelagomonas_calceolata.AAC.6